MGLAALAAAVDALAAQDLDGLSEAVRAERVLGLRRLVDRLEGHRLQELVAVDARGAAGAAPGPAGPSTASWLRARLLLGAGTAHVGFGGSSAICGWRPTLPGEGDGSRRSVGPHAADGDGGSG
jgi:hypothetical protein